MYFIKIVAIGKEKYRVKISKKFDGIISGAKAWCVSKEMCDCFVAWVLSGKPIATIVEKSWGKGNHYCLHLSSFIRSLKLLLCRQSLELAHLLLHVLLHGLHEVLGVEEHALLDVLDAVDAAREVLGHLAAIHAIDASRLKGLAEPEKRRLRGRSINTRRVWWTIIAITCQTGFIVSSFEKLKSRFFRQLRLKRPQEKETFLYSSKCEMQLQTCRLKDSERNLSDRISDKEGVPPLNARKGSRNRLMTCHRA